MKELTQDRLKEILSYDESTGIFTRLNNFGGNRVGSIAGNRNNHGYIRTNIDKKAYLCHRLAWLYVYGSFPLFEIDHINCNKEDNRIINLRQVDRSGNCQNKKKAYSQNKLGVLGVHYDKKYKKFRSQISSQGSVVSLGGFDTLEEAHKAYIEEKRKIHPTCTI